MKAKEQQIFPGTPEWESLCQRCGLCCLLKTVDEYGHVCMTRVRCRHMGQKSRLCDCYDMNFDARNDKDNDSCFKSGGSPVNIATLHNDYVVPGFCPYVKKFVGPNKLERPDVDFEQTISEDELKPSEKLSDYIIPGSAKYFKYNPVLSKKLENFFTK